MKVITGKWQDASGTPVSNGRVFLKLSQDATATGSGQIAPSLVSFTLDINGNLPANTQVWANDELTPANTTYTISVLAQGGGLVWGAESIAITGASPINLNLAVPTTQSVIFANPVLQNPFGGALQTVAGPLAVTGALTVGSVNNDLWVGPNLGQFSSMAACYAALVSGQTCHVTAGWSETFSANLVMNKNNTGFVMHGGCAITMGSFNIQAPVNIRNIFIKGTIPQWNFAPSSNSCRFFYTGTGTAMSFGGVGFSGSVVMSDFYIDATGAGSNAVGLAYLGIDPGEIDRVIVGGPTNTTGSPVGLLMDGGFATAGSTTQNVAVNGFSTSWITSGGGSGTGILCRNGCNYNTFTNYWPSISNGVTAAGTGIDFECVSGAGATGNTGDLDLEILTTGIQFGNCVGVNGNRFRVGLSGTSNTTDVVFGAASVVNVVDIVGLQGQGPKVTDNSPPSSGNIATAHPNPLLNVQPQAAAIVGTGAPATLYTFTIPANTILPGKGIRIKVAWFHSTGVASVNYQMTFGSTVIQSFSTSSTGANDTVTYTIWNAPNVQNSQFENAEAIISGGSSNGTLANAAENTANALTAKFTFNVANTDQVTPQFWSVELIQ